LTSDESRKYQVAQNDLLFIRVNGNPEYVGRCALFAGYLEPVYFNDHIMRVRVENSMIDSHYLAFLLNSPYGKSEIAKQRKTSAGQHTINQVGLRAIKLILPPIHLQMHFASKSSAILKTKGSHAACLTVLNSLFSSLQQRAFRGEL
jgi:restriction endonuclease S subunit